MRAFAMCGFAALQRHQAESQVRRGLQAIRLLDHHFVLDVYTSTVCVRNAVFQTRSCGFRGGVDARKGFICREKSIDSTFRRD